MSALFQQFWLLVRRYPLASISITVLLVLGGVDGFLWKRHLRLSNSYERTRLEGETMLLSLNSHARIQSQLVIIRDALTFLNKNLASEADLAGNLDYFYQIEKKAKIRLTNISQLNSLPAAADSPYRAIPFSLRLVGTYNQILAYQHSLETGARVMRVRNYRFAQDNPALDNLSLDLTIEMLGRP